MMFSERDVRNGDGITRRHFLKVGGLGLGGLGFANALRSEAATAPGGASGRRKAVVLVWLRGGPSHLDMYDPKPEAPSAIRGPFRPIATNVPGIAIGEHLPRQAQIMDKLAVVRSVSHTSAGHDSATHWMRTGRKSTFDANDRVGPSIGAVVSQIMEPSPVGLPAAVTLPERIAPVTGHARRAFDLDREHPQMRDRYGRNDLGESCLLARRLVEAGVRFVTIEAGGDWDTHRGNFAQLKNGLLPQYDRAVAALVGDLAERGLSDDVLVAAFGEFGRTPRINGAAGRDHWPEAMSVLFAGGGLQMGQAVGATNAQGEFPTTEPYTPGCVVATMYHTLGIDPYDVIVGRGTPRSVLPEGDPIGELVARSATGRESRTA